MGEPLRMNLGCGPDLHAGWVNVDPVAWANWSTGCRVAMRPGPPPTELDPELMVAVPWQADPLSGLPFGSDTFDGVVAHHVLQMLAWGSLVPWLAEVHRVLKPGGWLRLSVPDLLGAVTAYLDRDTEWFPIADVHEPNIDGKLCMYLTQAGATRSVFTPEWLLEVLHRVPASTIGSTAWSMLCTQEHGRTAGPEWLAGLDNRPAESIYVEAVKR